MYNNPVGINGMFSDIFGSYPDDRPVYSVRCFYEDDDDCDLNRIVKMRVYSDRSIEVGRAYFDSDRMTYNLKYTKCTRDDLPDRLKEDLDSVYRDYFDKNNVRPGNIPFTQSAFLRIRK